MSTAAIITGSMSGEICSSMGLPAVSGRAPRTWSTAVERLTMALSILVPPSNSSTTVLTFSDEVLVTLVTPFTVPRPASRGAVIRLSTCSGLAPGMVVTTTT